MKKLLFALLVLGFVAGCKTEDNASNSCITILQSTDTLIAGNYRLFLISTNSNNGTGALEVIDDNNNTIAGSTDFSIEFVQFENGNVCWQNTVAAAGGSSLNTYNATCSGVPSWAKSSNTKATIKLKISGQPYYLYDNKVNY